MTCNQINSKIMRFSIWIWLITAGAAMIRFFHLSAKSLWLDEAYSAWMAGHSLREIWVLQLNDSSPPVYYFILHVWMQWFGSSEAALRSLSSIASCLILPAAYFLAVRWLDKASALAVAIFLSISPMQIYYAQEVRMYSLAALMAILSVLSVEKEFTRKGTGWFFIPVMATMIWIQNYGWLLWGGLILVTMCRKPGTHRRRWIIYHASVAVLVFPWLLAIVRQVSTDTAPWVPRPGVIDLWHTLVYYSGMNPGVHPQDITHLAVIAGAVFAGLLLLGFTQSIQDHRFNRLFWFSAVFPLVSGWLLSFWKPMYLPGRYDSIFQTFFVIILCSTIRSKSSSRRWGWGLLSILLILQVVFASNYIFKYRKSNDREVAEYILAQHPMPDDLAITFDLTQTPLEYYLGPDSIRIRPFPEGARGWLPRAYLEGRAAFVNKELEKLYSELEMLPNGSRIFLVRCQELPGVNYLQDYLDKRFGLRSSRAIKPARKYNQVRQVRIYGPSRENNRTSTP